MSHYETNARDFLFPDSQFKTDFHGPQRDVRMTMNQEFPVNLILFMLLLIRIGVHSKM